jgi:predicted O-methyltransferase YrrM
MMYSRTRLAQKYLRYYLTAANGKGHGIHSPFVFDFVQKVLNDRHHYPEYTSIETLRSRLRRDDTLLTIEDMGAGSAWEGQSEGVTPADNLRRRSMAEIARSAAKPPRLSQLLFRLARYYQPAGIIELGTSLGLSTAYLAAGSPAAKVWSIEGAAPVAEAARNNLQSLSLHPEVLTGNFDEVLGPLLEKTGPVDLAFIDGNHRCAPTLNYFNAILPRTSPCSVMIFDDIHWSSEMEEAWTTIKNDPRVYLTIDLFFLGFVFRRDEFKVKQDFIIRF